MKKISVWMLVLMLMLSLCSCAVMGGYIGSTAVSTPSATDMVQETPKSDQVQQPDDVQTEEPQRSELLYGNTSGNLLSGSMARGEDDDVLYVAREDGVYALHEDGARTKLSDDRADDLNLRGGKLYYVAITGDSYGDEGETNSLVSIALDNGERAVLVENLSRRMMSVINYQDLAKVSYTRYVGLNDLAIWGDYAYYVADNFRPGMVTLYNPYEEMSSVVTYESGKSVWRIPLEGGEVQEIVSDLGNGDVHMCISQDGQLYYTTCYDSGLYPYPVVTFNRCEMDGSNQTKLYGSDDVSLEDASRELVSGLMVENGVLFVLATDSEGDFPHARINVLKNGSYELFSDATYYVNPVNLDDEDGDGEMEGVIWLSHGEMLYEQNEEGVYTSEYLDKAELLWENIDWMNSDASAAECRILLEFDNLLRFGHEFSSFEMAAFDDDLYLMTDLAVYHVDLEGSGMEKFADFPAMND